MVTEQTVSDEQNTGIAAKCTYDIKHFIFKGKIVRKPGTLKHSVTPMKDSYHLGLYAMKY